LRATPFRCARLLEQAVNRLDFRRERVADVAFEHEREILVPLGSLLFRREIFLAMPMRFGTMTPDPNARKSPLEMPLYSHST
jgi:hypothetical protein